MNFNMCYNYGIPNFDVHQFWDKPCNDEVLEWFFAIPGVETTNWIRFLEQHVVDAAFHSVSPWAIIPSSHHLIWCFNRGMLVDLGKSNF